MHRQRAIGPYRADAVQVQQQLHGLGIGVSLYQAAQVIAQNRGNIEGAVDYLYRNFRSGNTQSRFAQNLGLNQGVYQQETALPAIGDRRPKRIRAAEEPMNMDIDTGNGGYRQAKYDKFKSGRKKKRSALKEVVRYVKQLQHDVIGRYQSLICPIPTSQSLLSLYLSNYDNNALVQSQRQLLMPCYCFNLSSPPEGQRDGSDYTTNPLYRLYKFYGTATTGRNWGWSSVQGKKNSSSGTSDNYNWQIEHRETSAAGSYRRYVHDWSHVRLMLQGTTKYPVRFHVYVVQFLEDGTGPRREVTSSGGSYSFIDDDPTDVEKIAMTDYFWERFMHPKVSHPFAVTKRTGMHNPCMKVLQHKVYSTEAELSISSDVQPHQQVVNMFYRNGSMYDITTPELTEGAFMPQTLGGLSLAGIENEVKAGYSDIRETRTTHIFPKRQKDRWLLIVAENYQQVNSPTEPTAVETPSFDISVRGKYTMFDDAV